MLDRRTFIRATLGAAGAAALAGCEWAEGLVGDDGQSTATPVATPPGVDQPAPRPTLRLASPDIGVPSPYAYGPGTHSLVLLIYDTLLVRDADRELTGWLAAGWERSDDGLTYRFELVEGATWHDGEAVTAEDVAFSFDYFAAHADELMPTVLFRPDDIVDRVEPTGALSGEIRLVEPWAAFGSEIAARFPIVPRHVWEGIDAPGDVADPERLVGSGPYRLEEIDLSRGEYLFTAFDGFWLGTPFVERVAMRPVDDALIALRAGEVDAGAPGTGTPTREVVPVFEDDERFGVISGDPDFFAALGWNAASDGPAGDVAFRQACAHAIDRAALVERVLGDGQPGNPGILPPTHPAHHDDVATYPPDRDEARRLLDEAGYPAGDDGVRVRLTLLTFPELAAAAELVRDALGQVGVELEFEPTDFQTAVMTGALSSYEMALMFFGGLERDADLLREIFASDTEGEAIFHALGWRNAEFDEHAEAQARTHDEVERQQHLDRMQELLAAELPMLILYYSPAYLMYRREVFTEWSMAVENKQIFVTGKADGTPPIRPIADGSES